MKIKQDEKNHDGRNALLSMSFFVLLGFATTATCIHDAGQAFLSPLDMFRAAVLVFGLGSIFGLSLFAVLEIVIPVSIRNAVLSRVRPEGSIKTFVLSLPSQTAQHCPGGLKRPPRLLS